MFRLQTSACFNLVMKTQSNISSEIIFHHSAAKAQD